ncbi:MAG: 6-bladed beta-propeller [Acidobacteriota bacterium]|nr:6-bladed beta-propeller [Acidobacteriota bacterium]
MLRPVWRRVEITRGSRPVAMALLLVTVALAATSCHHAPIATPERIVWPPPPAPPRIEYLQEIRTPRDLGLGGSAMRRFLGWMLHGRQRHGLARPLAVAIDGERLVVADPDARSLHIFDRGKRRYRRLLAGGKVPLISPVAVALDGDGWLFASDSAAGRVLVFDARTGRFVRDLAPDAEFERPTGLAFDRHGERLLVVDTLAHRVLAFDRRGRRVMTLGGRGTGEGEFNFPASVTVGPGGRIYVADVLNFRVQVFTAEGAFIRAIGHAGRGPGAFDKIKGLAVDSAGHLYVVDALQDVIQVFDEDGRLLTGFSRGGSGAGEVWLPAGICIDQGDRIYVADSANHRLQVFRFIGSEGDGA